MIATSEYELLQESVGLVDRCDRAKLILRGAETVEFLDGQVSNEVSSLAPGSGCYATVLNHKGKLRADMRILRGEDWVWLDGESITGPVLRHMVETYSLGRDVAYVDATGTRAILSLVGPSADDALDVAPPPEEHFFVEGLHGLYVRTDLG
ncbi:MAG: hypothetical protein H0U84_05295, partial [Thermoleophilaceae bacterium]|nr:hypothetical protein [Thermoleophilaceae bacterium]